MALRKLRQHWGKHRIRKLLDYFGYLPPGLESGYKQGMKCCWAMAAVLCLTISAPAQTLVAAAFTAPDPGLGGLSSGLNNEITLADQPPMSPRLSAEPALAVYERRAEKQLTGVPSYAAATTITAELPQMNQRGAFELLRQFSAPHELHFKPVHFSGDSFVKSNVIVRLLQQDVEHAQKDDAASTAITAAHYKFIYRGNAQVNGTDAYIFEVKPRPHRCLTNLLPSRKIATCIRC